MKRALLLLALALFLPKPSFAQTPPVVIDIAKGNFTWTFSGVVGKEFHIKCGSQTGVYTQITIVADPTLRTLPANKVLNKDGAYFCVITNVTTMGLETPPSNEIFFSAGAVGSIPSNFSLQ